MASLFGKALEETQNTIAVGFDDRSEAVVFAMKYLQH